MLLLIIGLLSLLMMQNSVIQLKDKEAGVIIGKGYVAGIAGHTGGMNIYCQHTSNYKS